MLGYHGSPDSNVTSILPQTPAAELARLLNPWPALVYAGAHTHVRMLRPHQASLVVNPGSVGMASAIRPNGEDHLIAQVEFAILEADAGGIRVDFRAIELDRAALVDSARSSRNPDAGWWAESWSG